jgi:chloramphenicol-sensitive protein RarD
MVLLGIQILFAFVILNLEFNYLIESVPTSGKFYYVIIIIAVIFTVLPLFLNLFALNKINSATVGILMYINPIFNFTIAFFVFDERINFLQAIGYVIIIGALVLFNYPYFRKIQTAVSSRRAA